MSAAEADVVCDDDSDVEWTGTSEKQVLTHVCTVCRICFRALEQLMNGEIKKEW